MMTDEGLMDGPDPPTVHHATTMSIGGNGH
jgi:hypothetical protein